MRIVKEDLTGCINRIAAGAPAGRFWVIEEPIAETGICIEFGTKEEAEQFIREQERESLMRDVIKVDKKYTYKFSTDDFDYYMNDEERMVKVRHDIPGGRPDAVIDKHGIDAEDDLAVWEFFS
jgi:hypothetical protein